MQVKLTSEGPFGWVYYSEEKETLRFFWETTTVGFDISLPNSKEWIAFCKESNAPNAKERREEIVLRLAKEVARQEGRGAKVAIDDDGISFSYENNWFHLLLGKIFRLD
jgi:hypothetical protein